MTRAESQGTATDQREVAWSAAKLAVRSYARDPSNRNAGEVQRAWARVRGMTVESARLRSAGRPGDVPRSESPIRG